MLDIPRWAMAASPVPCQAPRATSSQVPSRPQLYTGHARQAKTPEGGTTGLC